MFPIIHWNLISLEISITAILVVLVIIDLFIPKENRSDVMGYGSLIGSGALIGFWLTQYGVAGATFNGTFILDPLAWFFKGIFLVAMFFVLIMAQQFFQADSERRNEFYLLLWVALIGMCLIASAADFLLLFIAVEIMTLSFYVMTAYLRSDKLSLEAGMKYLILGALSSGFFLYGLSLLYGSAHSTNFAAIQAFAASNPLTPILLFALVLILAMIGFKIAAVPFHMWVPDVYQGAPTPVTAFLSVGSKAAGFIILIRVFGSVFDAYHLQWDVLLAVLAAITMTYGNLVAMFQTNIKRLLGYSSISHAGYLLMGAAAHSTLGFAGMNFYLLGYLFTNMAVFLIIIIFSLRTHSDDIDDYAGLFKRSGLLGVSLVIALVSLAGMPPMVGFFGKFTLIMAAMNNGFVWLGLVAAVNIVIALYYYLKVAKRVFVDTPKNGAVIIIPNHIRAILIITIVAIIGMGIFQDPFFQVALTATAGIIP